LNALLTFFIIKNAGKIKNVKKRKNVTRIKNVKTFFTSMVCADFVQHRFIGIVNTIFQLIRSTRPPQGCE